MTRSLRLALRAAAVCCLLAVASAALLTGGARLTGGAAAVIAGGSMAPTIPLGAVVLVRPAPGYAAGDVVTYRAAAALTTHRVVAVHGSGAGARLVTKGDANPDLDPEEVPSAAVQGVVRAQLPWAGYLLAAVQSPRWRCVLLGIPLVWLLLGGRGGSARDVAPRASAGRSGDAAW